MWCTRKIITWNKQVQKGHISKCFKVRSTGSQSFFGNRVAFVTPKLFRCTSGSNPMLLNYDHKPHMITTHLGDCVITRVYFWIKYMGYWKGHKCPLYFVSMSFNGLPVISRGITQECSNTEHIIQSRFVLPNARNKLQTIMHSFSKTSHWHNSYINLQISGPKKNVLSSSFQTFTFFY